MYFIFQNRRPLRCGSLFLYLYYSIFLVFVKQILRNPHILDLLKIEKIFRISIRGKKIMKEIKVLKANKEDKEFIIHTNNIINNR